MRRGAVTTGANAPSMPSAVRGTARRYGDQLQGHRPPSGPGSAETTLGRGGARKLLWDGAGPDRCPPQETKLGGAVGIHGKGSWERRGDGFALVDWTWGCVAVRDQDILELFDRYAEVGIPVRIDAQ